MLDKIISELAKSIISKVGTGLAAVSGQVKTVSDNVSVLQSHVDQINQRVQSIVPDALAQLSDADLATAIDNIVTNAINSVMVGPQPLPPGNNSLIGENGLIGTNGLIGEGGNVVSGNTSTKSATPGVYITEPV